MKWIRHILPAITRTHRFVFRVTNGRLSTRAFGMRFLQLEHTGRKSGVLRKTPLLYIEDGENFVVAASNAGQDHHPAWWLNIDARPDALVWAAGERIAVRARRAITQEEERLWIRLQDAYPWFSEYKEGTEREIPIAILEPSGTPPGVRGIGISALARANRPAADGVRRVEVQHRFNAAPQAVWDVYTDHARWSEWAGTPGSRLIERGKTEVNGVGAVRGFTGGMREEVLSFDPPKRMTYTVIAGFFPIAEHEGEVIFEPDGDGTLVIWRCHFKPTIPGLGKILETFITLTFHRALKGLERYSFS